MWRRVLAGACAAAALVGCGDQPARDDVKPAAGGERERTVARSARLGADRTDYVLLSLRRVGRVLVSCAEKEGASVAFRADRLLPTADVVVDVAGSEPVSTTLQPGGRFQPAPARAAHLQTWHIGPFAAAGVRTTVISVAARRIDEPGTVWRCAASARATVSRDQGATRQG